MLADFAMRDNGFNTLRLVAAFAVVVSHAFPLTGVAEPLQQFTGFSIGSLAVCVFFLISGYLIPASLVRGSLWRYVEKRARRIMPGLVVAVLVCAFVLGPLATTLPAGRYLGAMGTYRFLGNMAFLPVGYDLPGVFENNPMQAVNGSLWSLKFEVACYVFVPLAMFVARLRKAVVIAALVASFAIVHLVDQNGGSGRYYLYTMAHLFRFYGMGMVFFLFADRIPLNRTLGLGALALVIAAAYTPFFAECVAVFGSYAVIVFAYHSPHWFRALTARGDISYGIYVYAFPIQQLLVPLTAGFAVAGVGMGWLANAAITVPLVSLAGLASWLLVEKPALTAYSKRILQPGLA